MKQDGGTSSIFKLLEHMFDSISKSWGVCVGRWFLFLHNGGSRKNNQKLYSKLYT